MEPARSLIGQLFTSWRTDPTAGSGRGRDDRGRQWRRRTTSLRPAVEPGLDGPGHRSRPVRATAIALLDLIADAKHDLLLVSFAAYKVPILVEAIARARERGVTVRFILDSSTEGGLGVDAKLAFAALDGLTAFYTWRLAKRPLHPSGLPASLHAKCAVADRSRAIVGSANLTGAALNFNMELGLEVRNGPLPHQLANHFNALIASGELSRADQAVEGA